MLVGAAVAAVNGGYYLALVLVFIAAAPTVGRFVAERDTERRDDGSDYRDPPAGLGPGSWGGGG